VTRSGSAIVAEPPGIPRDGPALMRKLELLSPPHVSVRSEPVSPGAPEPRRHLPAPVLSWPRRRLPAPVLSWPRRAV
jgi:hypothetical protein